MAAAAAATKSLFADLQVAQAIEVFELVKRFNDDTHADKVNLSVGGEYSSISLGASDTWKYWQTKNRFSAQEMLAFALYVA